MAIPVYVAKRLHTRSDRTLHGFVTNRGTPARPKAMDTRPAVEGHLPVFPLQWVWAQLLRIALRLPPTVKPCRSVHTQREPT